MDLRASSLLEALGRHPKDRSLALRYGAALAICALTLATRLALDPLPGAAPFWGLSILLCTAIGGFGPGLLAVLVATSTSWLLPTTSEWIAVLEHGSALPTFLFRSVAGVVIVAIATALQHQRLRARRLDEEVARRREEEQALRAGAEQARAAERAAQKQLETITERMAAAVTRCSRDLRYVWVSAAYADWLRLSPGEIVGRPIAQVLGEDAFAALRPRFERVLQGERTEYVEEVGLPGLGRRWIHAIYVPVPADAAGPDGWVAVVQDVTELKRLEAAAQASSERLRLAAEGAALGIFDWDVAADATRFENRRVYDILGLDPARGTIGYARFRDELMHPDDVQAFDRALHASMASDAPFHATCRIRRPSDGSLRWVELFGTFRRDAGGRPLTLSGVGRDVTESRLAEEALREADRRKDEFLAVLSHELRSPLQGILGWVEVLKSTDAADPAVHERGLRAIERGARAQAELVQDLLDVSRIVSGKLSLSRRAVRLDEVLRAVVDELTPSAEEKGLALRFEPCPAVAVWGDPERLAQIATNLVANAIKFTPRGGEILVRCETQDGWAALAVSDNGEGIEPDLLPHLFDRFRQGDSSSSRRYGGLGLGLAITHYLVTAHGGRIQVASEGRGKGATFTVSLPLAPDAASERPQTAGGGRDREALRGRRILLVEDEPLAREAVVHLLLAHGADVTAAASVDAALRAADAAPFDVLVSDLGLPERDGFDLLRALRARGHAWPAIALTAFADADTQQRAVAAGFALHLPKPVQASDLVTAVLRVGGAAAPEAHAGTAP